MTFPAGWILARSITSDCRPIENGLDPAPDSTRSHWLLAPQRIKDLRHQRDVNILDWQISEYWRHVGREAVIPLVQVGDTSPGRPMCRDVLIATLVEGHSP